MPPPIVEAINRFKLIIAYGILAVLMAIGLGMVRGVVDQQAEIIKVQERTTERHALTNCEAGNETREIVETVLTSLAEPREDDGPGEAERRRELVDMLLPTIERRDCEAEVQEVSDAVG